MKTAFKLLAVFTLVLAAFGQPSSVSAGGGGAFNFNGPSTLASFASTDASGCLLTEVSVVASNAVVKPAPGSSENLSFASITVSQYDVCNQLQLMFAYGTASPLSDTNFQISYQLDWATLNTTANLFDEVSGTNFEVEVELAWTGIGRLTRAHSNSHLQSPGCIVNSRSNGTFRSSLAMGSLSDGITNFTPEAAYSAEIAMVKSGTVSVGCD